MQKIIFRFIKDRRISILVYTGAGIAMLWMYVAMFPSIQSQAESLNELLKSYPEGFMQAFGITDFSFETIENFIGVEHFSIIWPLMLLFLVSGLASASIAREVEVGTVELMLARPVSRLKIFFSKYLTGLLVLLFFTACTIFTIAPIASIHSVSYQFSHFVTLAIIGYLFGWAVFSIAMLLSAFFSEKSKVSMFMGGLLVLMYVLNIVSALKDTFADLKYASFFYYFDYQEALIHNTLNTTSIIVFLAVIVVCTTLGAWKFMKRDIAV